MLCTRPRNVIEIPCLNLFCFIRGNSDLTDKRGYSAVDKRSVLPHRDKYLTLALSNNLL